MHAQTPEPENLDDLVARLRVRRAEAGSPSYGEIARRVGIRRRAGDRSAMQPARSTVYDCFRDGRSRIDVALLLDIVTVLGALPEEQSVWRAWCLSLQLGTRQTIEVLVAFTGLPSRAQPLIVSEAEDRVARMSGPLVVVGMPGVGKTHLAASIIEADIAALNVRRAITVDVRGSDPAARPANERAVIDAVARQLGMDAQDAFPDRRWAQEVADELERTRTAVLLDDVARADQIAALLSVVPTRVVATSRSAAALSRTATAVHIGPWSVDDTVALLRVHLGEERIAAEPDSVRRLAELTGGLPLATNMFAARLARPDGWSLADHSGRIQSELARLNIGDGVHVAFSQAYDSLDYESRRALRLLAAQPSARLPVALIPPLIEREAAATNALLENLRSAHLVDADDAVSMHRLVRAFALGRSWEEDPRTMREQALDRLADASLEQARSAGVDATIGHLIDLAMAVSARRPEVLIDVTRTLSDRLDARGMFGTAETLQRHAYEAALLGTSDDAKTQTALALGRTLVRRGRPHADAILTDALERAERTGAASDASSAANSLAVSASMRGEMDTALRMFRESLGWAERAGRRDFQGRLHDNIAILLRRRGELHKARLHHEEALLVAEELGDEAFALTVWGNLAELLLLMGDVDSALEAARCAVKGGDVAGDFWQASALNSLGRALAASGDRRTGLLRQQKALELAIVTGAPALVAGVHNDIGLTQSEMRDVEAASRSFMSALTVAKEGGVVFEQAKALIGLAEQEVMHGAAEVAAHRVREALSLLDAPESPEAGRARAVLDAVQGLGTIR